MSDPSAHTAEYGFASAHDLLADIASGELSSREIVEALLTRIHEIDDVDGGIQSLIALGDAVLEQADYADQHPSDRPLHGLPVLIKDNIEAVGLPATAGSLALTGRTVTADAPLVSQLRDAGAIILGSTNLSEWANIRSTQSTSGWSAVGGLTANPWKYEHNAGGSSSGSGAAIAAGLAPLAVGSETDGSIVCPSSMNGCVGIKPTVGLVSRQGMIPIANSMDSPGPMGRNVKDVALLLEVLSGVRNLVELCVDRSALRIGVVHQWRTGHEKTNEIFEYQVSRLQQAGIRIKDIDHVPDYSQDIAQDEVKFILSELNEDLTAYLQQRPGDGVQSLAEVVQFNQDHADVELHYFGQDLLEQALATGGRDDAYRAARERALTWAVQQVLQPSIEDVDVLIGPTYGPAWKSALGEGDRYEDAGWITSAPAIAGWPIGCLPMGFVDGLPVGMGVVARPRDEAGLVRAMARIEQVLQIGDLRPTFIR